MPDVLTASRPAHLWVPPGARGNYGDEVADVARLLGRPLDASQRIAVDALTSFGPGGRWLALEGCVKLPRQNGKTGGIVTPIVLADLFLWGADRIAWTAHLFKTTREAFADHKQLIQSAPEFDRRVRKIHEANGEESIELTSGARIDYLARSKGGGRGLGGKHVVLDEALFGTPEQAGAILPILAARENPRVTYASSGCKVESGLLRKLTKRGRAGGDPSLVFVEWCAPGRWEDPGCRTGPTCPHVVGTPGCALDDFDRILAANPAMAAGRIEREFMAAMRATLDPIEFGREFLGWDEPGEDEGARPIATETWAETRHDLTATERAQLGRPVFFLDVEPGGGSSSIAAAGTRRDTGLPHVELAAAAPGTDWLVARAAELAERWPDSRFAAEAAGAVGALFEKLRREDIRAGINLELFTAPDMGRSCAHLQNLGTGFTHHDDPRFLVALAGAVKRDLGEGLWAWGRRKSTTNISPLVAATGALWLLEQHADEDYDLGDSFG